MKITNAQCVRRTILMLADFLRVAPARISISDKLKKDWDMTDDELEMLEQWIEGPITRNKEGFFQDVNADVRSDDLTDPKLAGTVALLSDLIWKNIPAANKS